VLSKDHLDGVISVIEEFFELLCLDGVISVIEEFFELLC
jgi:hypothetical protein